MPGGKSETAVVFVLAGVNGAGKSSIGGAYLREMGLQYFNADEAAARIRDAIGCPIEEANSLAWAEGKRRLEEAIEWRSNYAFETTLGGRTIPGLLARASKSGLDVIVWFVGLSSADQHIDRVRERVSRGGHDIPEARIRERWDTSRRNLVALMPFLSELRVFDNSQDANAKRGLIPEPVLLLHVRHNRIIAPRIEEIANTPEWAKAIVACAMQIERENA
ncbi:MAG TPA: ZTL protein [Thermoanaerobaculia bacterium]|nr:ZTL protein [Thermoanaerobaculia bacterium]